jgi:SAM-dependent methyltransferase
LEVSARTPDVVVWHEVEFGAYAADLPLWEQLAADAAGPVLELGCGAGRVALHLARRGHEVVGIDRERALVEALEARARADDVPARGIVADATDFELDERFGLAVAPMQLVQLLGGSRGRRAMLAAVAAHLRPGATFAAALVEPHHLPELDAGAEDGSAPLPDVCELDGWTFSSLPLAVRDEDGPLRLERLRQTVSPTGELSEEVDITSLHPLALSALEAEAADAGLSPAGVTQIPATDWHVGSTVCVLEAPAHE